MLFLSTILADPDGDLALDIDLTRSKLGLFSRRVTRTATLDGGVVISDSGFSHGDRTLTIVVVNVDQGLEAALKNLTENNTLIHLAMADGFYLVALKSALPRNGELVLTALVKEKLT